VTGETVKTAISKRFVFESFGTGQLVAQLYAHVEVLWILRINTCNNNKVWDLSILTHFHGSRSQKSSN
jgi:hypothetical protein